MPKARSAGRATVAEQSLGFLAAGFEADLGYVGGYLLSTPRGRPIEFHYTRPVQPSPTHRILYGNELEPYIYESLIAATLLQQTTLEPVFVVTDQPLVLARRIGCTYPLVCVGTGAATTLGRGGVVFQTDPVPARGIVQVHAEFEQDREVVARWRDETAPGLDLSEPFQRIREALRELLGQDRQQAA